MGDCLLSVQPNEKSQLRKQDHGYAHNEFQVPRFVAEEIHANQRSDTASENGYPDQGCFRNAPGTAPGFLLINQHKKEAGSIDYGEVQKDEMVSHG